MYPTLFSTPGVKAFAEAVDAERSRQLAKFGDQHREDGTGGEAAIVGIPMAELRDNMRSAVDYLNSQGMAPWLAVLLEEVFEAASETDPELLRTELVQCGAVIAAWVYDLDRR